MKTPRIEETEVDEFETYIVEVVKCVADGSMDIYTANKALISNHNKALTEAHQAGRGEMAEHVIDILKQSYLMTNGYKDTDTTRTAMYIENEEFNIAINKRLDFFIEQIEALKDNK